MKNLAIMVLVICSLFTAQSCSKEKELDETGAVAFEFTNLTNEAYENITIDSAKAASCAIMVYYKDQSVNGNYWYPSPGLGPNGNYQTRFYVNVKPVSSVFSFTIYAKNGNVYAGVPVTFSNIKVVFIPYTLTGKKEPVDYSDYNAVAKYYGLKN